MPTQNQRKKAVKADVKNWWNSEHMTDFNKMKYHMTHAPILAHADYSRVLSKGESPKTVHSVRGRIVQGPKGRE
jgi:hypothetical protein